MKKLVSIIVIAVMCLALSMTAFAAEIDLAEIGGVQNYTPHGYAGVDAIMMGYGNKVALGEYNLADYDSIIITYATDMGFVAEKEDMPLCTSQKNKIAKENGKLYGMKKGLEKKGQDTAEVDAKIAANTCESIKLDQENAADLEKLNELNAEYRTLMLSLPNLPDPDLLPGGKENNVPLRYIGNKPAFDFEPKHHVDLCEGLGLLD